MKEDLDFLSKQSYEMQDTMNKVFEATKQKLDALEEGNKVILKDLIEEVVNITKLPTSSVSGLVNSFVHNYPGVKVHKGRDGGVFKGERPKKIDPRPRCGECSQVLRTWEKDHKKAE